jgi:hypothetical protein
MDITKKLPISQLTLGIQQSREQPTLYEDLENEINCVIDTSLGTRNNALQLKTSVWDILFNRKGSFCREVVQVPFVTSGHELSQSWQPIVKGNRYLSKMMIRLDAAIRDGSDCDPALMKTLIIVKHYLTTLQSRLHDNPILVAKIEDLFLSQSSFISVAKNI